eukprot:TRINITY_DN1505_c1_g1_i6.p1 TRINITY_DN1505_c1_g1~~TRINITY_DN1505_c1_g1_i6.p1  ORF type:complete len:360 (-),score=47.20 TRINITY_DN1505_c1_g1_i6:64-1143(-)
MKRIAQEVPVLIGGLFNRVDCLELLACGALGLVLDAAELALIKSLPRDRVVAFFSVPNDECDLEELTSRVGPFVGGFLLHRAHASTLGIPPPDILVAQFKHFCGQAVPDRPIRLIISGGISTARQVSYLHRADIDANSLSATINGTLTAADCLAACVRQDLDDGLMWTLLCNEEGQALSLVFSSHETLVQAVQRRSAVFLSSEYHGRRPISLVRISLDKQSRCILMFVRPGTSWFCERRCSDCCFVAPPPLSIMSEMRDKASVPSPIPLADSLRAAVLSLLEAQDRTSAAASAASAIRAVLKCANALGASPGAISRQLTLRLANLRLQRLHPQSQPQSPSDDYTGSTGLEPDTKRVRMA